MKRKWSEPAQARIKQMGATHTLRADRLIVQRKRRQAEQRAEGRR